MWGLRAEDQGNFLCPSPHRLSSWLLVGDCLHHPYPLLPDFRNQQRTELAVVSGQLGDAAQTHRKAGKGSASRKGALRLMTLFIRLPVPSSGWAHAHRGPRVLFGLPTPPTSRHPPALTLAIYPQTTSWPRNKGPRHLPGVPSHLPGSPMRKGAILPALFFQGLLCVNLDKWLSVNQVLEFYRLLKNTFFFKSCNVFPFMKCYRINKLFTNR